MNVQGLVCGSKGGVIMKRYLEQDVIAALEFWDVDGLTMKKFHYNKEEVDFDEVFSDIVKNRSQIGYYSSSLKDYQVWRKCM